MSYLINNQQRLNDIIFAGRNKNYGAYAIRSAYGNTLFKSLLITMGSSVTLMLIAFYLCRTEDKPAILSEQVITTIFDTTPPEQPRENKPDSKSPPPASPEQPKSDLPKNNNSSTTVVVDSLAAAAQSVESSPDPIPDTPPSNGSSTSTNTSGPGGPSGSGTDSKGTENKVHEYFGVDSAPEFEGGMKALYKFIASNLRYPANASGTGMEGTVHVKFVVDENGKVGSVQLENNAGYGFDEEAQRVVRMIPNFKIPAKVNGEPVKMYYRLPIKFKLR